MVSRPVERPRKPVLGMPLVTVTRIEVGIRIVERGEMQVTRRSCRIRPKDNAAAIELHRFRATTEHLQHESQIVATALVIGSERQGVPIGRDGSIRIALVEQRYAETVMRFGIVGPYPEGRFVGRF